MKAAKDVSKALSRVRAVLSSREARAPAEDGRRRAAVLVPFFLRRGELHILFTRRARTLSKHKGQNSFPGGLCEEGENPINAAIRETWEELGIKPDLIDVLGALTELPDSVTRRSRTRTHITPVMAHVMQDDVIDHLTINPSEVAYAFSASVDDLCDPAHQRFTQFRKFPLLYPVFLVEHEKIWGLTAFILEGVLQVLREAAETQEEPSAQGLSADN